MDDLISRQAAIGKLKRMATQAYIDKLNGSAETVINCCIDVIERQIPSAQPKPEQNTRSERAESDKLGVKMGETCTDTCTDTISRQAAIYIASGFCHPANVAKELAKLPSAQPEPHEIGYSECANAMLKMWIDNVLTDGEYSRIMDKLNAHWAERREE